MPDASSHLFEESDVNEVPHPPLPYPLHTHHPPTPQKNNKQKNTKDFWTDRHLWIGIFLVFLIIPVSCLRTMDALKYTSVFAICCFAYVTIIAQIYAYSPDLKDECSDDLREEHDGKCKGDRPDGPTDVIDVLKVAPIFIFAYTLRF